MDELSDEDKLTVTRARKIERFLSQPMNVAEAFTARPGGLREARGHRQGFREIVEGKHDELPEQAFYMVGTIEEAVQAAQGPVTVPEAAEEPEQAEETEEAEAEPVAAG